METEKGASNIKLIFTDHLGSTQQVTDETGTVLTTYDYYPFGGVRVEDGEGTNKQFSGKIKDETNLNYFEARYLDGDKGRFNEMDLEVTNVALSDNQKISLAEPQRLNGYSYALNNPLKYEDKSGKYVETVIDVISLGMSIYDYNHKKSWLNGSVLAADTVSLALPIPAVAGYIKNSTRILSIAKYFHKISTKIDDVVNLGGLFVKNIGFVFNKRAWSVGEAGNDVASLVGHFYKHGDKVGATTVKEYYKMANNMIDGADNVKIFKLDNLRGPNSVDYFDIRTNNLVGFNNNTISTFQNVNKEEKLTKIFNEINKIKSKK